MERNNDFFPWAGKNIINSDKKTTPSPLWEKKLLK